MGWMEPVGRIHEVAYVLACMKQITFDDGTVWENPEYQNWLSTYKAQSIAPEILHTFMVHNIPIGDLNESGGFIGHRDCTVNQANR